MGQRWGCGRSASGWEGRVRWGPCHGAASPFPSQALACSAGCLSSSASLVSAETNIAAITVTLPLTHTRAGDTRRRAQPPLWAPRPSGWRAGLGLGWPLCYCLSRPLGLPEEPCTPNRVATGTVASAPAPAWAGGFPAPGDHEGQRSTPQARGFRSLAPALLPASPARPPPHPRHLRPVLGVGEPGGKGFTHTLRTRARRAAWNCHIVAGRVGGEAWGAGAERAGKQVERQGRGGVTAHKSPAPPWASPPGAPARGR